eukprot:334746_1
MEAISDRIVQSVVKINNKGWNRSLFIASESQLSHLQCKSCAHICCEPVILNCPQHHDTSEDVDQYAQMYCYQCLMQMIEDNNNKCIIQGHSNPIVFRIKQIKKIIRATTVHCPYSLHMGDQQRHNNPDNHHVYDTPDDQDENKQHEGQSFNTCQWKGTLALLLTQHLPICIHKHDPMYVLNHQINALQHQVACYKRKVKSYEHKIKTLQCHRCSAEQKVTDKTDIDPSENKKSFALPLPLPLALLSFVGLSLLLLPSFFIIFLWIFVPILPAFVRDIHAWFQSLVMIIAHVFLVVIIVLNRIVLIYSYNPANMH